MTVTASELRKLASLNLSPDQMAGVLGLLADRIEAEDARKAAQAERKRQSRARTGGQSRDNPVTVTGQSRDNDVTPSPLIPPLSPAPLSPPIIPPSQKYTRARPKTAMPDDWQPDAATWAVAERLGFQSFEAQDQLERMRDWARNADAGKGRKSDWNAAFRNWLKRAADERRNKPQASIKRHSIADSFDVLDAVVDEAIRRTDGRGAEGGEADSGEFRGLRKSAA